MVASPASFNNRAGLARAVNENLAEGTEVFVAEMGTYGRGEIAELCSWFRPDVSVITAIGPVHLERFGTEDRIVEAKAEILRDGPCRGARRRRRPPGRTGRAPCRGEGTRVWRVSAPRHGRGRVRRRARETAGAVPSAGTDRRAVRRSDGATGQRGRRRGRGAGARRPRRGLVRRLWTCPAPPTGWSSRSGAGGVVVLDDTYNANPAGARAALAALRRLGRPTRPGGWW